MLSSNLMMALNDFTDHEAALPPTHGQMMLWKNVYGQMRDRRKLYENGIKLWVSGTPSNIRFTVERSICKKIDAKDRNHGK